MVFCFMMMLTGCIQLPGVHIISNTPDPIVGQWVGGELPASDRHIIFYENRTFIAMNFFLNHGETRDSGNWTKKDTVIYSTLSVSGETTDWVYDPSDDSIYMGGLPQMEYYRYKGVQPY